MLCKYLSNSKRVTSSGSHKALIEQAGQLQSTEAAVQSVWPSGRLARDCFDHLEPLLVLVLPSPSQSCLVRNRYLAWPGCLSAGATHGQTSTLTLGRNYDQMEIQIPMMTRSELGSIFTWVYYTTTHHKMTWLCIALRDIMGQNQLMEICMETFIWTPYNSW